MTFFRNTTAALAMAAAMLAAAIPAHAQPLRPGSEEPGDPAKSKPGLLKQVGIDQRLNERVPLNLMFKDETGRDVRLGEFFGKRPVVLALVYFECPMLCTQVLNGAVSALSVLTFDVGKEYDVIAVSINPKETPALAAEKKKAYLGRYKRPQTAAGWHFLTGEEQNIKKLADSVGFRYAYDPEIQQYAHGAGDRDPDAPRRDREVFLRHRVFTPRHPVRPDRSVGRTDRDRRRQRADALLPLRPGDREVRRDVRFAQFASAPWPR